MSHFGNIHFFSIHYIVIRHYYQDLLQLFYYLWVHYNGIIGGGRCDHTEQD